MGAGFFNALGKGLWQDMDYLFFRISDVWVFNGWDRVLTGYGLGRGFLRFRIRGYQGIGDFVLADTKVQNRWALIKSIRLLKFFLR